MRWPALGTVLPGSATSGGEQPVAAQEEATAGWYVEGQLSDKVQGGVTAGLALEESRGGIGPSDGVLPFVPADALKGKRGSYDVRSTARMTRAGCARRDHSYWQGASRVGWSKMRVPLSIEPGVFPAEEFAGEVVIQQALVEEQGDDAATPDLAEGRGAVTRPRKGRPE